MGRTKRGVAVVLAACGLFGCHSRKQAVVDAGSEAEEEAVVADAAATSEASAPSASAEPIKRVAPHCETGEVAIVLAPGEETCVVECKASSECPPGWMCDGEGPVSHNGRPGNVVHFCRSGGHARLGDGGSSAQDAGHPTHVPADAGPPAKKVEHHDAGAKR